MNFNELSKDQQVQTVKENFIKYISKYVDKPEEVAVDFKEVEVADRVRKAIKSINKVEGCICGECVELDLEQTSVGQEFDDVLDLARSISESTKY